MKKTTFCLLFALTVSLSFAPLAGQAKETIYLPDPSGILDAEAELMEEDHEFQGIYYDVFYYDIPSGSSSNLMNNHFSTYEILLNKLDQDWDCEYIDTEDMVAEYHVTVDDHLAYFFCNSGEWLVYLPDGMEFSEEAFASEKSDKPSGSSSGSFQNGSFLEGAEDPLIVDGIMICTECKGTKRCKYCQGSGRINYGNGYETCPICDGNKLCNVCDGTGNWGEAPSK
ncbi:MAG: hypothetical protein SOX32_08070 [Candidatus Choladocola sp.]|nr:hypothetical protein [Candidatus Choladocola sp.]